MKVINQIDIALEEIYVNIAHYAYSDVDENGKAIPDTGTGPVQIILDYDGTIFSLSFIDKGTKYNPLQRKDPDISAPAEEREIGGLGIFMVKKIMDNVTYRYEDGHNILCMSKIIK